MTKRVVTVLLLGLLAVPPLSAVAEQGDGDAAVTRELKNMAGTWKEIARVRDGQSLPADQLGTMTQDENGKTRNRCYSCSLARRCVAAVDSTFQTDDVSAAAARLKQHGAPIVKDVRQTAWGTRELVIKDDQEHPLHSGRPDRA